MGQGGDAIREWCVDVAQLADDLSTANDDMCGTAIRLKPFANLPQFDMKRTLMGEFNLKVESLRSAVEQASRCDDFAARQRTDRELPVR